MSYLVAIVSLDDDFHAEGFIPSGARVSVPEMRRPVGSADAFSIFSLNHERKQRRPDSPGNFFRAPPRNTARVTQVLEHVQIVGASGARGHFYKRFY